MVVRRPCGQGKEGGEGSHDPKKWYDHKMMTKSHMAEEMGPSGLGETGAVAGKNCPGGPGRGRALP